MKCQYGRYELPGGSFTMPVCVQAAALAARLRAEARVEIGK